MKKLALVLVAATALSGAAHAEDYLTGYAGKFDVIDDDNEAWQFGGEYRFNPLQYGIRPTVGVNVTTDGSVYGYGGINWDIEMLRQQLYVIPNFMVGAYREGDGKDLGGAIEFRSGLELAYQFKDRTRLGVAFNHISNGGIYDKNPGAETAMVTYSIPNGYILGGR